MLFRSSKSSRHYISKSPKGRRLCLIFLKRSCKNGDSCHMSHSSSYRNQRHKSPSQGGPVQRRTHVLYFRILVHADLVNTANTVIRLVPIKVKPLNGLIVPQTKIENHLLAHRQDHVFLFEHAVLQIRMLRSHGVAMQVMNYCVRKLTTKD